MHFINKEKIKKETWPERKHEVSRLCFLDVLFWPVVSLCEANGQNEQAFMTPTCSLFPQAVPRLFYLTFAGSLSHATAFAICYCSCLLTKKKFFRHHHHMLFNNFAVLSWHSENLILCFCFLNTRESDTWIYSAHMW